MENTQTADIAMHTKIAGQYSAQVIHADGSITEVPWFDNLILDSGLDDVGLSVGGVRTFCHVGTGTSTPAVGQLTLDSRISPTVAPVPAPGGSISSSVNTGSPDYVSETTYRYTFGVGAVVGNITEVGISNSQQSTGNRLFSRSLFKDGGGNPIAITVTVSDQLVVYHKLVLTRVLTDQAGSVIISGTTYGYTVRPLSAGVVLELYSDLVVIGANATSAYGGAVSLAPITATAPVGTELSGNTVVTYSAYTVGSYTRTSTVTFGPTTANHATGISGLKLWHFSYGALHQIVFDTPIMKTNLQQLTLNVQMSWGR